MKVLAIDLGGSHATCALVQDHSLLASETVSLDGTRGLAGALPVLIETLLQLIQKSGQELHSFAGLAFGFPGIVNPRKNRVISTNGKFPDAAEIELTEWSKAAFNLPLKLENDARLALLGERYAGVAHGFDDVVMMTLGTGVGGVAMIEGKLLYGKHFQAGCLGGHFPVQLHGRACSCGGQGCVEAEASTWALTQIARDWPGSHQSELTQYEVLDFEKLVHTVKREDRVAQAILDHCISSWAAGAVGMVHAYDAEMVVIGGSVMKSGELILPAIEAHVQKHAWTPWGKVQVKAAVLGSDAALFGAIPLFQPE